MSGLVFLVVAGCGSTTTNGTGAPSAAPSTGGNRGSATAAQLVGLCQSTLENLPVPQAPTAATDPVGLIRGGQLASLPVRLRAPTTVLGLNRYVTADMYLSGTTVPDPGAWRTAMTSDGFVEAEAIGYRAGTDLWGAEALQFAAPANARDFDRQTLLGSCRAGVIGRLEPILGLPGAVAYTRTDSGPPFRASIIVGASVVHLTLCECVEAIHPLSVLETWAVAVAAQFGLGTSA